MVTYEDILQKKLLIGIGFEKCGTTYLNKLFSDPKFHIFLTPQVKETFFFNLHLNKGLEYYCSRYKVESEKNYDFIVDITPSYIRGGESVLNNIKEFNLERQGCSKYIICLRNQVYRAFSHYVHDLFHHYSRFERNTSVNQPYSLSFFDEYQRQNNYYFTKYSHFVEQAFQILGKENILVLFQEIDFDDTNLLSTKISNFLEVDFKIKDSVQKIVKDTSSFNLDKIKIHAGKFPHFHFRKYTDFKIKLQTGDCFRGKKGKLYLEIPNKILDVGYQESVEELMSAYQKWTDFLPGYEAEKIYIEYFEHDRKYLESLLDIDLSFWHNFYDVKY